MKQYFALIFALFCITLSAQTRNKDYSQILKSKNIYEINQFLKGAHPDDPRRSVLKPKLIQLIKDYLREAKEGDQRVKELQEMVAVLKRRPSTKISFDEMNEIIKKKQIAALQEKIAKGHLSYADVYPDTSNSSPYAGSSTTSTTVATNTTSAPVNSKNSNDTEAEEFKMLMNMSEDEFKRKTTAVLNSLFDNDPTSKEAIVLIKNNSDCNIIVRIEGSGYTKFRLAIPSKRENSMVVPKGDYLFHSIVCGSQYASQKTIQKALLVALGNPPAGKN